MISKRSQTAPGSRYDSANAQKPSTARAHQTNISNKRSLTPSLAFPRNLPTPETCGKNNHRLHKRTTSAPSGSRPHSNCILDTRGKYYEQNGKTFDMMTYLKSKSFPRRIHRLINEIPNKTSEVKKEDDRSSLADDNETEDVLSASQIGLNNKRLLERRRGLHRQRYMNRSGVKNFIRFYSVNSHEVLRPSTIRKCYLSCVFRKVI